ncbi:MAG: sigma-54 dependent transcriptional regulator [Flavobacteriaceae bacterium]
MSNVQTAKQRFEIIGNDPKLNRAIEKALRVGPTDISVLITGESGVGKEAMPKIIHAESHRKHGKYIAVNCGAIPEGTIDSELFGHEKGAFTGATQTRQGYFEVADKGTIFLDEVGELPLPTQVRLLRVLETGEFMKVGSSKVQKTDVRIIAATNADMQLSIKKERFREDLYYRLSTVEIELPPLRQRKEDIHLLFRKFAVDFGRKYNMPTIRLEDDAIRLLEKYHWPGNIRQLRNTAEQISVLETERSISALTLQSYLPEFRENNLPAVIGSTKKDESDFSSEREILYKILFDMRADINELKKRTSGQSASAPASSEEHKLYYEHEEESQLAESKPLEILGLPENRSTQSSDRYEFAEEIQEEETLSLHEKEIELIKKSLERNGGRRKAAADELGISERTLYRKIKQYNL